MKKKDPDVAWLPGIALPLQQPESMGGHLPAALLSPASRTDGGEPALLASNVVVRRSWQLAPARRSADAPESASLAASPALLALEAVDGSTIFIRADALAEQLLDAPTGRGADLLQP